MTDNLQLIATRMRVPIPKEFSFPLGAEVISEALRDVAVYEELSLRFWYHFRLSTPSRLQAHVDRGEPLKALSCGSDGEIFIYPVFRQHRAMVKRLLLETGLPRLRQWFSAEQNYFRQICSQPGLQGRCRIVVRFSDETLNFEEYGARIVRQ